MILQPSDKGAAFRRCPICHTHVIMGSNRNVSDSVRCPSCNATVFWVNNVDLVGTLRCPFCNSREMFRDRILGAEYKEACDLGLFSFPLLPEKVRDDDRIVVVQFECFRQLYFWEEEVKKGDKYLRDLLDEEYSKKEIVPCPAARYSKGPSGKPLLKGKPPKGIEFLFEGTRREIEVHIRTLHEEFQLGVRNLVFYAAGERNWPALEEAVGIIRERYPEMVPYLHPLLMELDDDFFEEVGLNKKGEKISRH